MPQLDDDQATFDGVTTVNIPILTREEPQCDAECALQYMATWRATHALTC